jgi:vacuolar-type H+-ATPase subunit F/Vma7
MLDDERQPPLRAVTYVGDEIGALGYRLAGVHVEIAAEADLLEAFERACAESRVVLVAFHIAMRLPREKLDRARAASSPLLLIMPDEKSGEELSDPGARVRAELGMSR